MYACPSRGFVHDALHVTVYYITPPPKSWFGKSPVKAVTVHHPTPSAKTVYHGAPYFSHSSNTIPCHGCNGSPSHAMYTVRPTSIIDCRTAQVPRHACKASLNMHSAGYRTSSHELNSCASTPLSRMPARHYPLEICNSPKTIVNQVANGDDGHQPQIRGKERWGPSVKVSHARRFESSASPHTCHQTWRCCRSPCAAFCQDCKHMVHPLLGKARCATCYYN